MDKEIDDKNCRCGLKTTYSINITLFQLSYFQIECCFSNKCLLNYKSCLYYLRNVSECESILSLLTEL